MKTFKYLLTLAFGFFFISAQAHDASGLLPPAASGSEMWLVTCSDDGHGTPDTLLITLLNDSLNGPMVSLQVATGETPPRYFNIADPVGGDNNYSAEVTTNYGGDHYIMVNKNASGIASYQFTYHCFSGGEHTGTFITQLQ